MPQTCSKCSRRNPPEAAFCFFDGISLPGHGHNGAAVARGAKPFLNPFVFPSGRLCRTFDELAVACQEDWPAARDLLRQGYLESFFGGLGRSDLALAAREAARFPDQDRGLDQLLTKLPSKVLDAPKLWVEPQEVSLGTLAVGQDRQFRLTLENQGQRLLYGSVTVEDGVWLTVGDAAGAHAKLFQFSHDTAIPVHVRGKGLRASVKPLEGRLLVESNGGSATVTVRVSVPVKPYPDGPLAGALTPREVAQKAKAAVDRSRAGDKKLAAEVAARFQKGQVAAWYESNGWTYPVQGPSASGLGAVQQFFEALGLTPPPPVAISESAVALQGDVGARLRHTLTVSSPEKRPVYAHGVSDAPWLEVGRAKLNGRTATIPLVVPTVPDRPGETLSAQVTVTSNGQQKFVVPVRLTVGAGFHFTSPVPTPPPAAQAPAPVLKPPEPEPMAAAVAAAPVVRRPIRRTGGAIGVKHLLPAGLLVLALFGVLAWDLIAPPADAQGSGGGLAPAGGVKVEQADTEYTDLKDTRPKLSIEFHKRNSRFGITMVDERDPENPAKHKKLTYEENGSSNNTCIDLEGQEHLFGQEPGRWVHNRQLLKARHRQRWTSEMIYPEQVRVTQVVELVPGQGRLLDTVLVHYTLKNESNTPRQLGIRVMLDTFIGANDGVPFRIPGRSRFLETKEDFNEKQTPVYIQAWERPDLKNPGTIAHLGLKGIEIPGLNLEPIELLRICRWHGSEARWKWEPEAINEPPDQAKDSCVVLYWADRKTEPGERRDMAFTYGLNAISSATTGNSELSLTSGGSFRLGGEFTLTATVKNPQPGQAVSVALPAGLALAPGEEAEQTLGGGGDYGQVSWRVRSGAVGTHHIEVKTGAAREPYDVKITTKSIFD
jgi:hypothetical protein